MTTRNRIMTYIRNYIVTYGYSPTIREICEGAQVSSTSLVAHHIDRLERDGLILVPRVNGQRLARCMRLTA